MLTPAEAEAAIAAVLEPVSQEDQALADSAGRVLRSPILAERDAPPFDRVTMDGIALHFQGGMPPRLSCRGRASCRARLHSACNPRTNASRS